jgi:hypothetical protein
MISPANVQSMKLDCGSTACESVKDWVALGIKVSGYATSAIALVAAPFPLNVLASATVFLITEYGLPSVSPSRMLHSKPDTRWRWAPTSWPIFSTGSSRASTSTESSSFRFPSFRGRSTAGPESDRASVGGGGFRFPFFSGGWGHAPPADDRARVGRGGTAGGGRAHVGRDY